MVFENSSPSSLWYSFPFFPRCFRWTFSIPQQPILPKPTVWMPCNHGWFAAYSLSLALSSNTQSFYFKWKSKRFANWQPLCRRTRLVPWMLRSWLPSLSSSLYSISFIGLRFICELHLRTSCITKPSMIKIYSKLDSIFLVIVFSLSRINCLAKYLWSRLDPEWWLMLLIFIKQSTSPTSHYCRAYLRINQIFPCQRAWQVKLKKKHDTIL